MLLRVQAINSFYGKSHILHDVSLEVAAGEVVSLLGRNGAGKTTTLKSIVGVVTPQAGRILFDDRPIQDLPTHLIAQQGIALVPEHRGVFALLTVEENLEIAARNGASWSIERVYQTFPRLKERRRNRGANLSGGEQQMLAMARALVNGPHLLLLDEPTEGLAPTIIDDLIHVIDGIRRSGIAVLLVEQNLKVCMTLADRHYVLEQGAIVYHGNRDEFRDAEPIRERYLTLGR